MRQQTQTLTTVTTSPWLQLDTNQAPFVASVQVTIEGGTATYSVEATLDPPGVGTPAVFPLTGLTALTASALAGLPFLVRAVRLNVTAITGGAVRIVVEQAQR